MIEIIIAIIIQISTVLGGTDADKEQAKQLEKTKIEKTSKEAADAAAAEGGAGNWDG